jgi:glycosyltransferase involved in cell wall biosynthesis
MGAAGARRSQLALSIQALKRRDSAMKTIRILVDSFADAGLPNAQMGNGREIVSRLDSTYFHVGMFVRGTPDPRIRARKNTRLIQLPEHKQTIRILSEFLWGGHSLLFYLKASPASRWYMGLRRKYKDRRTTIGTIESQSNLKDEPSVRPEMRRLFELTVLRCDHLFSNSANVQSSFLHEYGRNSQIIPTGVDTQFFAPDCDRPQNHRPRVLFVGSLRTFKQPQFLLSAAARFPNADFRIAGEGPLGPDLTARIAHEELGNVRLLGLLNAEQLRSEYRNSDVFLFPSLWEGSPKVVLEAAACGLPVIVRNNYSPETVVHGSTGFQAASDDDIYSSLDALLTNFELRRSMGHAGRLHSLRFDWSVIVAQWEETFARLAYENAWRQAS